MRYVIGVCLILAVSYACGHFHVGIPLSILFGGLTGGLVGQWWVYRFFFD